MKISTYKSKDLVLFWKRVGRPLQLRKTLPLAEEYFRILFMSDGKREHKTDKQIGLVAAVLVTVPVFGGKTGAQFANYTPCLWVNPYPYI